MLTVGFEEAITRKPFRISYRNQPKTGYPPPPPCCQLNRVKNPKAFECGSTLLPDTHDEDFYYTGDPEAARKGGPGTTTGAARKPVQQPVQQPMQQPVQQPMQQP
eukprot:701960-Prorocentrum_minimum.AAC.1